MTKTTAIGPSTNGAAQEIAFTEPYVAVVTIVGTTDILFHAWNCESVAEKASAAKGSKAKKYDNIESYVYRMSETDRRLGIPGNVFHGALINAAKFLQDPRSPRKSAADLVKAALIVQDIVAPLEPATKEWDFIDKRRVFVQRSGITRERPAMRAGWRVSFKILVALPEYIAPQLLNELVGNAGKLIGLCDYRPTYGRFQIVAFDVRRP
jgi:hypothetical protein